MADLSSLLLASVPWLGIAAVVIFLSAWVLTLLFRPKPLSLKGRHVFVVGGSSGIGLAIAELAVREGAHVSIAGRDKARLDKAHEQLAKAASPTSSAEGGGAAADSTPSPRVFSVPADFSDSLQTKEAMSAAAQQNGPITVLVCCQGICRPFAFEDTPEEAVEEMMAVNFFASANAVRAALPFLKQATPGEGRVVLVSSQAAQCGVFGYAAYGASKAALRGFAEGLQMELLPLGIRVGILFPTDTDTPMMAIENKTKPEITKLISASTSMMSPADVASRAMRGIKAGDFFIAVNFDGEMLNAVTAGMAPQPQVWRMFLEVALMGVIRIVALATVAGFNSTVLKYFRSKAPSKEEKKAN